MLSGTNDQMMEPYMNIQTPERTLAHTVAKVSKTELVSGLPKPTKTRKKTFGFWFKTQNPNFTEKNRLTVRFDRFSAAFRFKIQILNEK
jgi:hypothetical protein